MIPIRYKQLNDQITSDGDMQAVAFYTAGSSHTQSGLLCYTVGTTVLHSRAYCVTQSGANSATAEALQVSLPERDIHSRADPTVTTDEIQ